MNEGKSNHFGTNKQPYVEKYAFTPLHINDVTLSQCYCYIVTVAL